ncbi:MAG TPA: hypothetical protein DDX92_00970 [Flavobacteriales bacterium]|jgi:hypothetical protein|nr:hypothetical protein [Flavobacteriales bacterium]
MTSRFTSYIALVGVIVYTFMANGQNRQLAPLLHEVSHPLQNILDTIGTDFHPTVQPYLERDVNKADWFRKTFETDYFTDKFIFQLKLNKKSEKTPIKLSALPIGQISGGFEGGSSRTFLQTGIGVNLSAMVGSKLDVNINILSSNSSFPLYVENYIFNNKIVPGQGWANPSDLGYFYNNSTGYVSYSPGKYFNVTVGYGKNFWGEGYRSMMLSDAAYNYGYLRLTTNIWKIQYTNLFTSFRDIYNRSDAPGQFNNKYGSFHYLSLNLTKRWNIGLFEGIIWQGSDSLINRGFDIQYLNPIIFLRPVEYSIGSADNALLGMTMSYRIIKGIKAYGQFILDEFLLREIRNNNGWWGNKFATQLGLKYYNAFNIERLTLLTEWNLSRPYMYSHDNPVQAYGHWNEPLAHPSGANFNEYIIAGNYYINHFVFQLRYNYLDQGIDRVFNNVDGETEVLNYGSNIFRSNDTRVNDFNNTIGQGINRQMHTTFLKASWLVSTKANLWLEASFTWRYENVDSSENNLFFPTIGIRTGLYNQYWDF